MTRACACRSTAVVGVAAGRHDRPGAGPAHLGRVAALERGGRQVGDVAAAAVWDAAGGVGGDRLRSRWPRRRRRPAGPPHRSWTKRTARCGYAEPVRPGDGRAGTQVLRERLDESRASQRDATTRSVGPSSRHRGMGRGGIHRNGRSAPMRNRPVTERMILTEPTRANQTKAGCVRSRRPPFRSSGDRSLLSSLRSGVSKGTGSYARQGSGIGRPGLRHGDDHKPSSTRPGKW